MLPKISVITPSYNQGMFIEECILSVIGQQYPNLEYIIIDGGSTDNTIDIIKKYQKDINYWVSEKDNGQSDAINKGFSRATGDIIAWLNSDDLYYDNSLWKIADIYNKYFDNINKIGFILGNGYRYKWPEKSLSRFCQKNVAFSKKTLEEGLDYILQPSVFVLRHAANDVGYLNEKLHFCMDWEWWNRLSESYKVVVTDDMLSLSREYDATKTSTGKMKRWIEIQQLTSKLSGQEITAGSLFFLAETLKDIDNGLVNPLSLTGLWNDAKQGLKNLCDQYDSFPYESDQDVITYVPVNYEIQKETINLENYPKITVITPSYNQANYLERTILSVINQNYPNLEYIVIDGGSTDGSIDIIKKYEDKITIWKSEKDSGPADAINKGLKLATGNIIGWLNSDDVYTENSLYKVAREFLKGEKVVYGHALYVDINDKPIAMDHGYQKTKIYLAYQQDFYKTLRYWETVYMIPQPTVFWSKDILEEFGCLNQRYKFIFDYEYFLRLTKAGINFKLIDNVQALYRIHNESKTNSFDKFYEELYEYSKNNSIRDKNYKTSFLKYYITKLRGNLHHDTNWHKFKLLIFTLIESIKIVCGIGNPEKDFNKINKGN